MAGLVPLTLLGELVSIGTLLAFVIFCGVMAGLPLDRWLRLMVWLAIGLAIYFAYSRDHGVLQLTGRTKHETEPPAPTYTEPSNDAWTSLRSQ